MAQSNDLPPAKASFSREPRASAPQTEVSRLRLGKDVAEVVRLQHQAALARGSRLNDHALLARRGFLRQGALGLGGVALASLLDPRAFAATGLPHFAPKARRVIYLFMAGG